MGATEGRKKGTQDGIAVVGITDDATEEDELGLAFTFDGRTEGAEFGNSDGEIGDGRLVGFLDGAFRDGFADGKIVLLKLGFTDGVLVGRLEGGIETAAIFMGGIALSA